MQNATSVAAVGITMSIHGPGGAGGLSAQTAMTGGQANAGPAGRNPGEEARHCLVAVVPLRAMQERGGMGMVASRWQ